MRRLCLALIVCLSACASQKAAEPAPAPAVAAGPTAEQQAETARIQAEKEARAKLPMPPGLDEAAMDPSADPCNDFYAYACGGWMKTTEIPADRPLYSRGFIAILERNEATERQILEEAAAGKLPQGTPFAKQLSDVYATCMDETKLEKALPEVQKLIAKVATVKNAKDLAKSLSTLQSAGIAPLFEIGADQDLKNSNDVIFALEQGGLGLPDRDYYTDEDEKKKSIRAAYQALIAEILTDAGEKPAQATTDAQAIMDLETGLAKVSLTRVQRRDPESQYHRVDRKGIKELAPHFDWDTFFAGIGMKDVQPINANSLEFFKEVDRLTQVTKPEVWKAYLTWVVLRSSISALPKKFQEAHFLYTAKNFTDAKEDRPRWKKCAEFSDRALGEALGREYVRRTFGEDGKTRTRAMVDALQGALKTDITNLPWMDEATKQEAFKKLERMTGNNKIGYTDEWRDYSTLKTSRDSFFSNARAAYAFEVKRQLNKIGKPVDRKEWGMTPPTVNAYNNGQKNEIVFPAGILQPPFFNREATDAVNFGSMGMVVGHEITHGFDDQGAKFDTDGNLRDWWAPASQKAFNERTACVKKQYDEYVAIDDIHLKGDLTLGENVADLGGLKVSHLAMKAWYEKNPSEDDKKYRFNDDQQFFLGFAQSWCTKVRPNEARRRAVVDPHSPPFWRVTGPLSNLESFRKAYHCPDDAKMVRTANRCEVW